MVLLSVLYHEGKSIRRKLPCFSLHKNVASVFPGRPAPTAERDDCQPVVGTTSIRNSIDDFLNEKFSHYKIVSCVLCPVSCMDSVSQFFMLLITVFGDVVVMLVNTDTPYDPTTNYVNNVEILCFLTLFFSTSTSVFYGLIALNRLVSTVFETLYNRLRPWRMVTFCTQKFRFIYLNKHKKRGRGRKFKKFATQREARKPRTISSPFLQSFILRHEVSFKNFTLIKTSTELHLKFPTFIKKFHLDV